MQLTRQRYQLGSLRKLDRKRGPSVWEFRYRDKANGGRQKQVTLSALKHPTEAHARRAVERLVMKLNAEDPLGHYRIEQSSTDSHSGMVEAARCSAPLQVEDQGPYRTSILCEQNPEGLSENRWREDRPQSDGKAVSLGWHSFRHTYRSLLDASGAPIGVQQKTDAARAGRNHDGRVWQRADGIQARSQQQSCTNGAPTLGVTAIRAGEKTKRAGVVTARLMLHRNKPGIVVGFCGAGRP